MNFREVGWEGVKWFHLAQHRDHWWALLNTVMNVWVPWKAANFLIGWVTV